MLFSKRKVNKDDLFEFSMVPLIDPVTKIISTPNTVTVGADDQIYLVSLSNQYISFTYEMPRYFTLVIAGRFVMFYVINHTDMLNDEQKMIFVKGIKIPIKLAKRTQEIKQLIVDALLVYYEEYTIAKIASDDESTIQYYTKMADGRLYYE